LIGKGRFGEEKSSKSKEFNNEHDNERGSDIRKRWAQAL
jgi:hypothetical protein